MISKSLIAIWTLLIGAVMFKAISQSSDLIFETIFLSIIIWGSVVIPVALIGLLFRKRA